MEEINIINGVKEKNRHYKYINDYFSRNLSKSDRNIIRLIERWNKDNLHKKYKLIFEKIKQKNNNFSSVLDAGCGCGDFVFRLIDKHPQLKIIVGLDFLDKSIKKANKRSNNFDKSIFIKGNLLHIPFEERYFSVTLCIDVLQHIYNKDVDDVIKELTRVTDKYLLFDIKNKQNVFNFCYDYLLIPKIYKNLPICEFSASYMDNLLKNNGFHLERIFSTIPIHCFCRRLILVCRRSDIFKN